MWFISGVLAFLLTLIDMSDAIYIPAKAKVKYWLYLLVFAFAFVNGVCAVGLYLVLIETPQFKSFTLPAWLLAVLIGAAYLALVRLKLATYKDNEREIPLGIEFLYEYLKKALVRFIKDLVLDSRYEEASDLAAKESLDEIAKKVRFKIDKTLEGSERENTSGWLYRVLQDANTDDNEKKITLCDFLLSGKRN